MVMRRRDVASAAFNMRWRYPREEYIGSLPLHLEQAAHLAAPTTLLRLEVPLTHETVSQPLLPVEAKAHFARAAAVVEGVSLDALRRRACHCDHWLPPLLREAQVR